MIRGELHRIEHDLDVDIWDWWGGGFAAFYIWCNCWWWKPEEVVDGS